MQWESQAHRDDRFSNLVIRRYIGRKCDGVLLCFSLLALSHGERRKTGWWIEDLSMAEFEMAIRQLSDNILG